MSIKVSVKERGKIRNSWLVVEMEDSKEFPVIILDGTMAGNGRSEIEELFSALPMLEKVKSSGRWEKPQVEQLLALEKKELLFWGLVRMAPQKNW